LFFKYFFAKKNFHFFFNVDYCTVNVLDRSNIHQRIVNFVFWLQMRDMVVGVGCLSHDQSRCVLRSCSVIICDPDSKMMASRQVTLAAAVSVTTTGSRITHSRAKSEKIFFERRARDAAV
jgi:hypothetical protein